uniref:Somatostatin/Cortistatin C-terminal domain-containing protein n=1 Tax=Monopterus albus TaxID=43700 RepID=A0A3Q3JKK6_MONAL
MLQCTDGGTRKTKDGLYANKLYTPPFLELATTYKTEVSQCCTTKVHIHSVLWCLAKTIYLIKKHTSKIFEAKMAQILCVLAVLCFAVCVVENTETDRGFRDLQLQKDSLSLLDTLQDKQESIKPLNSVDFFKSKNKTIHQAPKETEKQEKNRRGLGSSVTTQRTPGCRMFYWKSWATC